MKQNTVQKSSLLTFNFTSNSVTFII